MLATNSPVASQLVMESFGPSGLPPLEANMTMGGAPATPLKKL